jgi:3-hydroxybutyryl-CoA dehydrogenase
MITIELVNLAAMEDTMAGEIGVVGAGTMGAGIAQSAAAAGMDVRLFDVEPRAVAAAMERIAASLAKAAAAGRMGADEAAAAAARLKPAARLSDFCGCSMVIEAIIEDEGAKKALFRDLSAVLPEATVIATNTSCLSVSELAEAVAVPERFVGLHYFFPAAINPLLEVIAGRRSGGGAVAAAFAFGRATGKQPILCADVYGFAVNRFFVPYLNEAVRLADEGFAPAEIERVAREAFGTKAGPFKVMDLTKPEIALHSMRTLERLGSFYAPAAGLVDKVADGGAWNVPEEASPSPRDETIRRRLFGAVLFAVREELAQQVASPADIDLGARIGLQWNWQPCAAMAAMGEREADALVALVR